MRYRLSLIMHASIADVFEKCSDATEWITQNLSFTTHLQPHDVISAMTLRITSFRQ